MLTAHPLSDDEALSDDEGAGSDGAVPELRFVPTKDGRRTDPESLAEDAIAVVARPDADKGEQLIAATNKAALELGEIREAITAAGLPNLAAPREIKVLEELPVLGSGKTNYPELNKLVQS